MYHNYATRSGGSLPGADAPRGRCPFSRWLLLCLVAGGGFSAFGQTQTLSPARNATDVDPATTISAFGGPLTEEAINGMRVFSHHYGGRRTGSTSLTGGNNLSFFPSIGFKPGETVFTTLLPVGGLQKQVYQFTTAAAAGPGTFSGGSDVTMGFQSRTVVPADVDGDGDLDVLTANVSTGRVEVARNDGSGGLGSITQVPVGAAPLSIAAADLDADGDLDLLVANANGNSVSVRFNNGGGGFSGDQNVPVGQSPYAVAAADVDADGDLDLLAANFSGNSVSVRLNNGTGSFSGSYAVGFPSGHGPASLVMADMDGDGDLDAVTANAAANVLAVSPNEGDGTFDIPVYLPVGASPGSVAAADLDRDGDLDLLSANANSNTISVRYNNGGLSFSSAVDVLVPNGIRHLTTADVDGDGDLDVLATCFGAGSTVIVRLNNSSGNFVIAPTVNVGNSPYGIAAADMDGDGDLDLLTGNYGGTAASTVSVRLNQPLPPVLLNSTINKPAGLEDQTVTFTAADFTGAFSPAGTLAKVRFVSLPPAGTLKLGAANVALNQEIPVSDLGSLAYVPAPDFYGSVLFQWNGSNGTAYASAAAQVNLSLVQVNDPPTLTNVSKPAGTEDTEVAFAAADFTNAFNDVDLTGNLQLTAIQITSLPANGQLRLSGVPVALNQQIVVGALQALRYVPNPNFSGNDAFAWNATDGALYAASPALVNITVQAVNDAPVLAGVPATAAVDELVPFTFGATATDPDGTANPLTFSLTGAPAGAAIDPATGAFSWTPTEAQGAGSYAFLVKVSDGTAQDEQPVTVTVKEVNAAPVLAPIGNKEMDENSTLTFPVSATDPDAGAGAFNQLTYEVTGADGARVSAAGVFTWTALEEDGPGTFTVRVRVRDNAAQSLDDVEEFTITVREVNTKPQLVVSSGSFTVNEGAKLTFSADAYDPDLPYPQLTFSLEGAPAGAAIHPTDGDFSWTPTEAQGPQVYSFLVKVSDGTDEATKPVTVTVNEVNTLPVLAGVPDQATVPELTELRFTATATDADLPPNELRFGLRSAPEGATIDPLTGVFSWTPTEAQGGTPADYRFAIEVQDGNQPGGYAIQPIRVTVEEVNQPPVLQGFPKTLTADELVPLTFELNASDPDIPYTDLTYSLVGAPAGAAIDFSGTFSWTPTEGQGSNTYTFTVRVSDGRLADEGQVTITVNETNQKPVLADIGGFGVNEHTLLTFKATATDPDVPANGLTYTLQNAPAGATIDAATGNFSWTPAEDQDGLYIFVVTARDNGVPSMADNKLVTVNVFDANAAPVLAPVGPRTVQELSPLTFTATATDADRVDGVADVLAYSLINAPLGAAINPATGAFSWTPTEAQDGSFTFTVRVTDGRLSDQEQITVTVQEINTPPALVLAAAPATVNELAAFTLQASATDADVPANPLTFSLVSFPAGAAIHPTTGLITWTPTEAQGNNTGYGFTVRVSDGALTDTKTFSVVVQEVNAAPVLARIGSREVDEGTALAFQATATDVDLPANALTFALVNAPAGASIDAATGNFSWTPTEAQGPGVFTFTVKATDNGTPAFSDEEEITVTVKEVNAAPVLAGVPATREVAWGNAVSFLATATDADVPANTLTFSLVGAPAGAAIAAGGAFSWTPDGAQVGSYAFTVKVTDNGTPSRSDEQQITIVVSKRATALVYNGEITEQYSDQVGLSAVLTDTGGGLLNTPLPGKTITFALNGQSAGATTGANGVAVAAFKLDQPAGTTSVKAAFAGDALYLPSADNDPFVVTRENADVAYAGLEYFATANASSSLASVEYVATLTDKADGSRGAIPNAQAVFSGSLVRVAAVSPLNPPDATVGGARTGVFTEKLTPAEYSSGGKTYPVEVSAGGLFYTGQTPETTLITVAVPGSDYVNGGGNLVIAQSGGTYAATAGSKMNFGFTMKWNKSGKNIQGQANVIFRRLVNGTWRTYQIKSNAINTLGTSNVAGGRRADFNTKANVTDITNPLAPVSLGGGLDLSVQAFESTDRAYKDQISVTVRNGNVLVFSSFWNGAASEMRPLNGGTVRVRSSAAVAKATARENAAAAQSAGASTAFTVDAYPNPFASTFYLNIGSEVTGDVALTVVDGKGRTVTRRVANADGQGAARTVEIDLSGEPHGVYFLHVQSGARREVIKVFKRNR